MKALTKLKPFQKPPLTRVQWLLANRPEGDPKFRRGEVVYIAGTSIMGTVMLMRRGRVSQAAEFNDDIAPGMDWSGNPFVRDRYGIYTIEVRGGNGRVVFAHETELEAA